MDQVFNFCFLINKFSTNISKIVILRLKSGIGEKLEKFQKIKKLLLKYLSIIEIDILWPGMVKYF